MNCFKNVLMAIAGFTALLGFGAVLMAVTGGLVYMTVIAFGISHSSLWVPVIGVVWLVIVGGTTAGIIECHA